MIKPPHSSHNSLPRIRAEKKDLLAMDPLKKVTLDGPEKFTYVSSLLSNEEREQLQLVLLNNIDVFAWSLSDMVGINPTMASHKLNIIPMTKPLRHKVRRFHPARHQIIQTEVDNLLRACFIREVKCLEWLANVVVVPKKGGKWRVCVDYTDLNEAYPKYSFPLLHIDQVVDAATGNEILLFLNYFSRYHQIPMHPIDSEKMTFITFHGLLFSSFHLYKSLVKSNLICKCTDHK